MHLLTIERDILLKPIQLLLGFVERKQLTSILANIYIKKSGSKLILVGNDMEMQASIILEVDSQFEDFAITLPGRKLFEAIKSFGVNDAINFEQSGSKIKIYLKRTKFTLQGLPAEHYPLLKVTEDKACQFSIPQGALKSLIAKTQYAIADNDTRVFLNGALLEVKDNQLNIVATDAHRLSMASFSFAEGSTKIEECSSIIPRKTVFELYRLLDESEERDIAIKVYPHQVHFETRDTQIITKLIAGKYPSYEKVIPLGNDKVCLIDRLGLLMAMDRVSAIGSDKLRTVTFKLTNNTLAISSRNEEQEDSYDELEIQYDSNEELELSFNLGYIKDVLLNCPADVLQWAFFDNKRSVIVTIPNELNFKAVIMPLRH